MLGPKEMSAATVAARRTTPPLGYWIFAMALQVFGIVGAASIGFPFFVLGATLVLVGLTYRLPVLFWSLAVIATAASAVWVYL